MKKKLTMQDVIEKNSSIPFIIALWNLKNRSVWQDFITMFLWP